MVTPETSPEIPSMEYQPTSDTFNQTIVALDAAKAEGTTFISSEELSAPVSTPPSTPTEVLNLDQMVAKFNGEKIPDTTPDAQEDPFAPMKKALEAEEKKTLEAKGVDINGIPLILQPEANVESPIPQPEPISEPSPAENQPSAEPEEPAKTKHPPLKLEEPQLEQTPTPTTTLSLDEIMDSGILPAPQSPPTPPPSTEISTKIDFSGLMKKLKKNAGIFAGVGGLIVAIFVLFTMFPSEKTELPAPVENLPPTTPTEDHDSAPETPSGGVSLFPDSSETSTTEDEFQPTIPDEIFPTEPSEIPADPQPLDGADEQPIFPTEISTQDMIQNLMSQYNFAQQLVEI